MKPLFTVHGGEFIVGDYISRKYRGRYEVWVPTEDTGVDLLVTHAKKNRAPIRIQVKASRSYSARGIPDELFLARGWFVLDRRKARKSRAAWWVFVVSPAPRRHCFLVVPKRQLVDQLGRGKGRKHLYLTFLKDGRCIDARGLKKKDLGRALFDGRVNPVRDWSNFVDAWKGML